MILTYPWHVGFPKRRPKEFAELADSFEWIELDDCLSYGRPGLRISARQFLQRFVEINEVKNEVGRFGEVMP